MVINSQTRITLKMSITESIMALAERNPGALSCLMQLLKHGKKIDPDSAMGGLGVLLSLDTHSIYGSRIYMLWNDVCDKDLIKMCAILRACQLGFLSSKLLLTAIEDSYNHGLNLDEILHKVQERLPDFGINFNPIES